MDLEKISPEVEKLAVGTSFCVYGWLQSFSPPLRTIFFLQDISHVLKVRINAKIINRVSESPVTPLTELDEKDSIWPSLLIGLFIIRRLFLKIAFKRQFSLLGRSI